MTTPIPAIGDRVHYHPGPADGSWAGITIISGQPHAAVVAAVHGDKYVNLAIVDSNGVAYSRTSVPIRGADEVWGGASCSYPEAVDVTAAMLAGAGEPVIGALAGGEVVDPNAQASGFSYDGQITTGQQPESSVDAGSDAIQADSSTASEAGADKPADTAPAKAAKPKAAGK